mmetsp:Transcript_27647/g.88935  ORF Transcript_27647/g.88935 Transcript_27647/m.88935 type:complete len:326 (-) Transcript_27647:411-1388(-)
MLMAGVRERKRERGREGVSETPRQLVGQEDGQRACHHAGKRLLELCCHGGDHVRLGNGLLQLSTQRLLHLRHHTRRHVHGDGLGHRLRHLGRHRIRHQVGHVHPHCRLRHLRRGLGHRLLVVGCRLRAAGLRKVLLDLIHERVEQRRHQNVGRKVHNVRQPRDAEGGGGLEEDRLVVPPQGLRLRNGQRARLQAAVAGERRHHGAPAAGHLRVAPQGSVGAVVGMVEGEFLVDALHLEHRRLVHAQRARTRRGLHPCGARSHARGPHGARHVHASQPQPPHWPRALLVRTQRPQRTPADCARQRLCASEVGVGARGRVADALTKE